MRKEELQMASSTWTGEKAFDTVLHDIQTGDMDMTDRPLGG